jgi:hypothetical protein
MKKSVKILLIFVFTLFTVKLVAQDTIKLTLLADRYPGKSFFQQPCKRIIIQNTDGKEFTVNWGDGAIETIISDNDNSIYRATTLYHTYDKAGEYKVIIATSDTNCRFTYFDCSGSNQLTNLDLTGCSALTRLWCQKNQLANLNLTGCSALTDLSCYDNQLKHLDLTDCLALQDLKCQDNQLKSLDLTVCSALQNLDCQDNQLTNLDVSGCSALTDLNCDNNQLTNLNLSGCPSLKYLRCSYNQLQLSEIFAEYFNENVEFFHFDEQNLATRTVMPGEELFAEQSVFNGIFTSYVVIKDEDYYTYEDEFQSENDYTVIDGKITFNNIGRYSVTMTNEAMDVYYSDPPELIKVTVEIIVERYE